MWLWYEKMISKYLIYSYYILNYNLIFKIYTSIKNKVYDMPFKLAVANIATTLIFGNVYVFKIPDIFF